MNKFRKVLHYFATILAFIIISLFLVGCHCGSPSFEIAVENQTSEILTVSFNAGLGIEVMPGKELTQKWLRDSSPVAIVAKSSNGSIVFSQTYNMKELDNLGNKVTIK
jgi:hypothetical protein